jgi:uncharacterized protein (TIGR03435 family)
MIPEDLSPLARKTVVVIAAVTIVMVLGGGGLLDASSRRATERLVMLQQPRPVLPITNPASSTRREFDATSVKVGTTGLFARFACQGVDGIIETFLPSDAMAKQMIQQSPVPRGRCMGETNLAHLIALAYKLPADGGPEWSSTQRFQIEATATDAASVTTAELSGMLGKLLTDRFKLQFHRERRDTPGFALIVVKNGPKFKPATGPEESPRLTPSPAGPREWSIKGKSSMQAFADFLVGIVSQGTVVSPVVDSTNMSGMYEYAMTFPMSEPGPRGGGRGMLDAIAGAIEDQLGLRIESRKLAGEKIVIDHAERPTQN